MIAMTVPLTASYWECGCAKIFCFSCYPSTRKHSLDASNLWGWIQCLDWCILNPTKMGGRKFVFEQDQRLLVVWISFSHILSQSLPVLQTGIDLTVTWNLNVGSIYTSMVCEHPKLGAKKGVSITIPGTYWLQCKTNAINMWSVSNKL